jgi:predicted aldo/keto reductase-like oxidoreductase
LSSRAHGRKRFDRRAGGHPIGIQKVEQENLRLIRTAIDNGINFLDNSWDYSDGVSEIRMGKSLQAGYHKKVFS